jgi:hypothetical protein
VLISNINEKHGYIASIQFISSNISPDIFSFRTLNQKIKKLTSSFSSETPHCITFSFPLVGEV